ncbi:MAG: xanthine/uracil/vitamin C permease, partial [Dehalococcoidia bacterium]|nr:xanthine/uracil/vitamin C permease [Dehalococcoidia bacterium]
MLPEGRPSACGSGPCPWRTTSVTDAPPGSGVRYEPDERPPVVLTLGAGLQAALVVAVPVVITVAIVARIAGQPDAYIAFAAFAALLVSGATTGLQAVRGGSIGSGHVLITGASGAFIAVCVAALEEGGPALMASLVVVSSLVYFQFAQNLAPLRRVFTPAVSGTAIMLVAATVLPVVFGTLREVPEDAPEEAAPLVALTTLVVALALVLRGPPALRLWAPVAGVAAGCAVAVPYGLYDAAPVADAAWLGAPLGDWPGVQLVPDRAFWTLLPAFVAVTIAVAVITVGDGIAIQRVSRREPRTTDFRTVRGALDAGGVGNLLSGMLGTLPGATSSSSVASAEATGVAARRVGVVVGAALLALAFLPKVAAALIAIPPAVAAAYIVVLLGLLFVRG